MGLELGRTPRRVRPVDRQPLREAGTPDRARRGRRPVEDRRDRFHLQLERIVDFAHRVRLGELSGRRRGDGQTPDRPYILLPAPETCYRPRTKNLDRATGYWRPHNPLFWNDPALPRRLDAVRRRTISNGTRIYAVTEFEYDNKYTTGNLTQEKRWDSVKSAAVPALGALSAANSQVRIRAYDDRGNLTEIYAPDIRTTIAYASLPGVTGPGPYPTRVTYAAGTTLARTWDYVWDKRSGQLLSATDAGNNVATTYTYDALGRPKTVTEAGLRKTAITYYDDTRRVRTVHRPVHARRREAANHREARHAGAGRRSPRLGRRGAEHERHGLGRHQGRDPLHPRLRLASQCGDVHAPPRRDGSDAGMDLYEDGPSGAPHAHRRVQGRGAACELRRHREPDRNDGVFLRRQRRADYRKGARRRCGSPRVA